MSDFLDDTSEPTSYLPYSPNQKLKSILADSVTNGSNRTESISIPEEDCDGSTSTIIDFRDGDQLPLIESSKSIGIMNICRRILGINQPILPFFSLKSEEEEVEYEEVKEGHEECPESKPNSTPLPINNVTFEGTSSRKCSMGILLASVSCIFFATSSLIVKISTIHPMKLLCVRGLLQAIFVVPVVISSGNSILGPSGSRSLLLARAILGSVSLIMAFNAIHLIPLADASTVIFTSPVFVSIFACICLRELCSCFDVSMISLTVVGVILVSKPSFGGLEDDDDPNTRRKTWTNVIGIICGMLAAMLTALAFIVLRQLKQVHYSVTVFWFSFVLATFGGILTLALDDFEFPLAWEAILQLLGIGVCGFFGQVLLTKSLQMENAGPVAVARTLDIVLSFLYEIIFLNDTPDIFSYAGALLVASCVVLTAFRRWFIEVQAKRNAGSSGIGNIGGLRNQRTSESE